MAMFLVTFKEKKMDPEVASLAKYAICVAGIVLLAYLLFRRAKENPMSDIPPIEKCGECDAWSNEAGADGKSSGEGPCMIMPPWAKGLWRKADDLCDLGLLRPTPKEDPTTNE